MTLTQKRARKADTNVGCPSRRTGACITSGEQQVIFHPRDARHRPGCPFSELALAPQVTLAVEPNHITVDPDMNVLGVHFSIAFERIFDAFADIDDVYPRAQGQPIIHPKHAGQLAHRLLYGFLLVLPVDLAFEGDPAVLNDDLNRIRRYVGAPVDDAHGAGGDGVVRGSGAFVQAHLDLLGDCAHAFDAFYRALGADLLFIATDMSGERDNAVFHGNTDAGCIDLRLEFKLFHNGFAQTQVAHDGVLNRIRG